MDPTSFASPAPSARRRPFRVFGGPLVLACISGVLALAGFSSARSAGVLPPLERISGRLVDSGRVSPKSGADSLVLWDTARVLETSQVATGHASWTAPCFGDGADRTCGDASSLLFDDATVDLQGGDSRSLARLATIRLPLTLRVPGSRLRIRHELRLHVDKSANAQATLIVQTGGVTSVIDFPRGTKPSGDRVRTIERAFPPGTCRRAGDPSCSREEQLVLLLVVARDGTSEHATLTVDADDIAVRRTSGTRPSP